MRRKRKIDTILITTALVLIAAVFVSLTFRLIKSSSVDGSVIDAPTGELTEPRKDLEEDVHELQGLIDRHQPDIELTIPPDEVQEPVPEFYAPAVTDPFTTTPMTITVPTTTTTTTISTSTGTTFKTVDIRYYVLSDTGLNLRESPSTKALVKQKLEYGQPIRVIGLSDDWAKVRLAGYELGYVSRDFISKYPPVTTALATTTTKPTTSAPKITKTTQTTQVTTQAPATTPHTTTPPVTVQPDSPIVFIPAGTGSNRTAVDNFAILQKYGLINKAGSSSINRHYESFKDNGDGTITVDGVTFVYSKAMGSRRATHYDGLEVCIQSMKAGGGKCWLGHTTPTNHGTASGLTAQRGIIAVPESEVDLYPRGTVVFVRGYGIAVVGDRSNTYFDLCYDAGECRLLTRNNSVSAIYIIATP